VELLVAMISAGPLLPRDNCTFQPQEFR